MRGFRLGCGVEYPRSMGCQLESNDEESRELRQQQEAQLRALFDCMPQLGWAARADGWLYYYNQQWYDYTGTTIEQMQGWGWQSVHHPDLLPLVLERWRHSIATGEPFEMAFQLRRFDGVFRWFLTRVNPMRGEDGTIVRWVGINTDIEEQKQAEDAAASANRAKDEFLAILGHELRNPLAPIVTALHLMEKKGGDAFRHERDLIARQTAHLTRLVDDLLDVSRFMRGDVELRLERVNMRELVEESCEMISVLVTEKHHTLEVAVPLGLTMDADPARIKQLLGNLLTNAARYTPPGGRISLDVEAHDGTISIRVRDNGIGICAEMLPRLFDPFVQKRQSLARSEGGLGLGLTIARTIVAAHGGTIEALSDGNGKGSELLVRLPIRSAALAAADRRQKRPSPSGRRRRRVLVVDDNTDAAELLAAALEREGHTVRVAFDATTALSDAEVFGPEIALLDLGLPKMDGYELARRLRQHPRLRSVRVMAVTGYGQSADRERTTAAGFDCHFVKPVDLDALVAAMDSDDDVREA